MYTLGLKERFHLMHVPSRHETAVKMSHIVHDSRFWPVVAMIILITVFIGLAVWAALAGEPSEGLTPTYPFPLYDF